MVLVLEELLEVEQRLPLVVRERVYAGAVVWVISVQLITHLTIVIKSNIFGYLGGKKTRKYRGETYFAYLTIFVWYADSTAGVNTARGGGGGVTDTGTVIRLDKGRWWSM